MLADLLLTRADVLTLDPALPRAETVAIAGGRIVGVGSLAEARELTGPATRTIDLGGGAILPGFQDAHNHACFAGRYMLTLDLHDLHTRGEYLDAVAAYAVAHPEAEWIFGGGWALPAFPGGQPRREDLDRVAPGRPVYLMNCDLHGAWVSSRALELAGVDRDTPDPPNGRIECDPDGTPTGMLQEWARDLVARLLPPTPPDLWRRAILAAQRHLHALGITAWQDAWVEPEPLEAYRALAASGELTGRVVACQWWQRTDGVEQIPAMVERRGSAAVGRLRAGTVKVMQDGVPENFTSALVEPYLRVDDIGGGTGGIRRSAGRGRSVLGMTEDHVLRNRASWDVFAQEFVEPGHEAWASDAPSWGTWGVPEAEVGMLEGVEGLDAIELGCGTAYVSAWLARRGARPVGLDNSPVQLATARRFQDEFDLRFPLVHGDAEATPFPDRCFDLAISEYGAAIWCDPHRWIPEAARILRPGGRLVFLGNSYLSMVCTPLDEDAPTDEHLHRDHFGMHRFDWAEDDSTEFHIPHGEWIRLLRANGFEIEDLVELRAPEGATTRFPWVRPEWARRWPSEEVWKARR